MKTNVVRMNIGLALALILALGAGSARAGANLRYFVGYGLYPCDATDVTTTDPGTGLLANNGSGRALIQLVNAGIDGKIGDSTNRIDPDNAANGYVAGNDEVWQSAILEAGVNGVDEWGFTSSLPAPYIDESQAAGTYVFVRVFQDDTPQSGEAYFDSQPMPINAGLFCFSPDGDVLVVESGSGAAPTAGVALNRRIGPAKILDVEFCPETAGFVFAVPTGYALQTVYGAEEVLPSGEWKWQALIEGTHYSIENNAVSLFTAGENAASRLQIIRLGLRQDL